MDLPVISLKPLILLDFFCYSSRSVGPKYDLSCRPSMLKRQLLCMQGYLNILEYRARIESIELDTFSEIHIQI
mgnify:CR=1